MVMETIVSLYLKCMELACKVLLAHLEPVYLLQVSKNDDKNVAS